MLAKFALTRSLRSVRHVLLLTATINPPSGVPLLARTDPALRLQDYAKALSFYLKYIPSTFDGIVFAENSESDLSVLKQLVSERHLEGRVEFLSVYGLDHPPSYGRGYGEFKLVDHAMQNSLMLQAGNVFVWKCTGRYMAKNVDRIVRNVPSDVNLYCHCRNYPQRLCELFMMGFDMRGYENIVLGAYKELRNDATPGLHTNEEVAFRTYLDSRLKLATVIRRFNVTPVIDGVRGWNNSQYSSSLSAKLIARRVGAMLFPSFWI